MADNYQLPTPGTGPSARADDVGGQLYQVVKLAHGADGSATMVEDSAAGALPVKVTSEGTTISSTTTPLGSSATWTSATFDTNTNGSYITGLYYADQAGTHIVEESLDGTTWDVVHQDSYVATDVMLETHLAHSRYVRHRFVNGASAQGTFRGIAVQRYDGFPDVIGIDDRYNAVVGDKTNNAATASAEAFEVLPAIANAAAPTRTEGTVVALRTNLAGDVAVTLDGESVAVTATNLDIRDLSSAADSVAAVQSGAWTVTAANTAGDVAHDGVDSGNPVKVGGVARSTNPTAVASGDRAAAFMDLEGRTIVQPYGPRALTLHGTITLTSTTETTLLAAAAGVFHDLCGVVVANTSATAVRVDFRDSTTGTIRFAVYAPAGQTVGFMPPLPVTQAAANNNWTAQLSAAVTDVRVFAVAVKKTG